MASLGGKTRFLAVFAILLLFISPFLPGTSSEAQVPAAERTFREGLSAFQAGRNEEALGLFQRAIQEDPFLVQAHYFLGLTHQRLGDHEKALPSFQRAVDLNPRMVEARASLGVSLFRLRRFEEASRQFSSVLAAQPDNPTAHFFLGLTYQEQRDYDSAIRHLERAAELDPALAASARFNIGISYERKGDFTKAREALEEVVRLEPTTTLGATAQDYLALLDRRAKVRRPWSLEIEAGFEYTDNIVRIERDQVTEQSDVGGTFALAAAYRFLDIDGYTGTIGYDFFDISYFKASEQSFMSHAANVRFDKTMGPWELAMSYRYEYNWLDNQSFLQVNSLTPRISYFPDPTWAVDVSYQVQEKTFFHQATEVESGPDGVFGTADDRRTQDPRDAINNSLGFNVFYFFPRGWGHLLASYRYETENANARRLDYHGHVPGGAIQINFPTKTQARFGFTYRQKIFEKNDPGIFDVGDPPDTDPRAFVGRKRQDDVRTYRFSVKQEITPDLSANVRFTHTNYGSNLGEVDFKENVVAVTLAYKF